MPAENTKQIQEYTCVEFDNSEGIPRDFIYAVRKRPGMYLGDLTGERGLYVMFSEVVKNSLDQYAAGNCREVTVSLLADGSVSVEDDGPGISAEPDPETGVPFLEAAFTKRDSRSGIGRVGAKCVNALSDRFHVETWRAGKTCSIEFCEGRIVRPLEEEGDFSHPKPSGTKITFLPDRTIFGDNWAFTWPRLEERLREFAFLNPGVRLTLRDERPEAEREEEYHFGRGMSDFLQELDEYDKLLHRSPLMMRGGGTIAVEDYHPEDIFEKEMAVEIGLCFTRRRGELTFGYTNGARNTGGTHLDGLRNGISRAVTKFAGKSRWLGETVAAFSGEDCAAGILAVVSVKHPMPRFRNSCRSVLLSGDVYEFVSDLVFADLCQYFEENPGTARIIFNQVNRASHARFEIERLRRAKGIVEPNIYRKLGPGYAGDSRRGDRFEN